MTTFNETRFPFKEVMSDIKYSINYSKNKSNTKRIKSETILKYMEETIPILQECDKRLFLLEKFLSEEISENKFLKMINNGK